MISKLCEDKKVIGYSYSIHTLETRANLGPCTYPAKYKLTIKLARKTNIMHVCGVHKNSIISHGKKVGFGVLVEKIK